MEKIPQTHDIYQVCFFTCPAYKPFHFAIHPWVVIVKNGTMTRWEVIYKIHPEKEHFGYVHKNYYTNPSQGIEKSSSNSKSLDSHMIGSISGNENSLAKNVIDFIEEMSPHYPYQENYTAYPGPNSNTYIAWILGHFPDAGIHLPWNAFGKKYK